MVAVSLVSSNGIETAGSVPTKLNTGVSSARYMDVHDIAAFWRSEHDHLKIKKAGHKPDSVKPRRTSLSFI